MKSIKGSLQSAYLKIAGGSLLLTGLVKVPSVLGTTKILDFRDPVLTFLSIRQSMAIAVVLELTVFAILWRSGISQLRKIVLVTWLASAFGVYRYLKHLSGSRVPCPCFGHIAEWTHLSATFLDAVAFLLLAFLLVGGATLAGIEFFATSGRNKLPKPKAPTTAH